MSVIGGVVGAFGTAMAAESKASTLRSQARATQVQGTEAQAGREAQAEMVEQQAAIRADTIRRHGERLQAKATAIAGASGVETGQGDVVLAAMDNAANIETDALRAKYSGDVQASELRYDGAVIKQTADYNAAVMRQEAQVTYTAGFIGAEAQVFGGAAQSYANTQALQAPTTEQPASSTGPQQSEEFSGRYGDQLMAPSSADATGASLLWD